MPGWCSCIGPARGSPIGGALDRNVRRPFTRSIDKTEIGRQDSDRWLAATELMIAAAQEQRFEEPISVSIT